MSEVTVTNGVEPKKRILSIDVLRGWNMFWLIGGASFVFALAAALPCTVTKVIAEQAHHAGGIGFHHHDLIFPLFLFLAGASWPFSLGSQVRKGVSKWGITFRAFRRFLLLAFLGAVLFGLLKLDFAHVRFNSILGRIGFGWFFAAMGLLWCGRRRFPWYAAFWFFGYWAACLILPHVFGPDGATAWGKGCFQSIFDNWLGGRVPDKYGGEGFFQAFGCISSASLGVFAGLLLSKEGLSEGRKTLGLLAASALCGLGAWLAGLTGCPCFKSIWSPTYILVAGTCSFGMLGVLHWIVDVKGFTKWAFFFKVIGMNAFTIYVLQWAWFFPRFGDKVFGGVASLLPEVWGVLLLESGYVLLRWLVLLFLYRKKIFIRL